jgi:putative SOS response-associated peptidase YedK
MCGRFVAATPPDVVAAYFGAEPPADEGRGPRYNVAPTTDVFVVLEDGGVRKVTEAHWGLVPVWAKDPSIGNRMINARAETLAEKNSFKSPFKRTRCIVPADGFYEWKKVPGQKAKQPVYLHSANGEPLAFAGLWTTWRPKDRPEEAALRSATIVTTSANDAVAPVHDRMPVILPASAWDAWLDAGNDELESLGKLLVPAASSVLAMHEVSTDVNSVRNQGPDLILPKPPDAP